MVAVREAVVTGRVDPSDCLHDLRLLEAAEYLHQAGPREIEPLMEEGEDLDEAFDRLAFEIYELSTLYDDDFPVHLRVTVRVSSRGVEIAGYEPAYVY